MIEAGLACVFGIKSWISIKESTFDRESKLLHKLEALLQMLLELPSVMMVACNNSSGRNDEAIGIGKGEDIRGFCTLAPLVSH